MVLTSRQPMREIERRACDHAVTNIPKRCATLDRVHKKTFDILPAGLLRVRTSSQSFSPQLLLGPAVRSHCVEPIGRTSQVHDTIDTLVANTREHRNRTTAAMTESTDTRLVYFARLLNCNAKQRHRVIGRAVESIGAVAF